MNRAITVGFALVFLVVVPTFAQNGGQYLANDVFVSDPVIPFEINVDLRTLEPAPIWQPGDPIEVVPEQVAFDGPTERIEGWIDPVLQDSSAFLEGASFPGSLVLAFEAHPPANSNPPDTVGAVGPNHYIAMVNASRFSIWDKLGNNLVPPTFLRTLWTGGSSPCQDGDGDPIVEYDNIADRWMMQEFDLTGNTFCIYISQGPNPVTDGWYAYSFSAPSFPDYPQYGVWPDAYYAGTFESPNLGIYAFDRTNMLAGLAATFQRFAIPRLDGSSPRVTRILPANLDGTVPPPGANPPNPFVRSVHETQDFSDARTRLELWEFHVDWVTPANSTFTLEQDLIPAAMALLPCSPGVRDCVPQPGTSNMIDALFNRLLRSLQYRVLPDGREAMVVNQVVDVGAGVGGVRWFELSRAPLPEGAAWTLRQDSTYSPDSTYRFMGSAAMNAQGDIALAYSASSTTDFPSIRATARREADALNTMTMEELTVVPGAASLTSSQRWGDYTSLGADPSDDKTFWLTNQILTSTNQRSVWVGAFRIEPPLFEDGFESGDFSAWDFTAP